MPTQRTIWGNLFNLLALLALLAPSKSFSAQITWLGNNSTDIRDAANWVGDVAPAPNTDSALFGVAGTFGVNIVNPLSGANQQYAGNFILGEGGLQFSSAAPSYTFSGSSIRLGNGGVWNASSGTTQTFNNDFSLNTTNSFTFDANNAQTVVNGDIDLLQGVGTRTISVAFRNTVGSVLTLNGDLVNSNATPGTGSLTTTTTSSALATQAGYVVLRGNNSSLNGTITVAGGTTVRTESANGLGTAAISLTTAAQVGTLEIGLDTGTTFSNAISGATSTGGTMRLVSDRATAGAGVTHGISFASNTMTSSGGIAIFQAGQNVTSGSAGFNVGALTLGAASNTGLLSVGANVTIASLAPVNTAGSTNNFQLGTYNTGLAGSNDGRFTITGALANGSGGRNATLTTFGTGIVTLQGTNTYTGTTTLNGGRLVLDYGTNNTSKLADGFALNLNSGILDLAGGSHTEVVALSRFSVNVRRAEVG